MAYVNFWKLPAAQYNPSTHGEGIFQCSDTGDTYIFGVLNTSLSEENKSNVEKIIQGINTLGPVTHVMDTNAFIIEDGQVKLNFECVDCLNSPEDKSEHKEAIPEATTSQNGLMSAADKAKISELYTKSEIDQKLTDMTPSIGENGNWFVGGVDSGVPSKGADGVSLGEIALVQTTGTSAESVMSQNAVTEKFSELESKTNSLVYVINNGGKEDLVTLANSVIVKLWINEDALPDDISEDKTLYLRRITKNHPEVGNQIWLSYKKNDGTVALGNVLQLEQGVQYGFVKNTYSEAILDFTKLLDDNNQPLFSNNESYLINPIAFDTAILSSELRKRQNIISSFIIDESSLYYLTLINTDTGLLSKPYNSAIRSILIPVIPGNTYELQDISFATGYENIAVFYSELPNRENSTSVKISTAAIQSFSVIAPETAAFMVINIYFKGIKKNPRVIQKTIIADNTITSSNIIDNSVSADKAYVLDSRNMYQYFVQPKSNTDNLIVRTNIYLRSILSNIKQGDKLRFYDQEKDNSWCSSQLIEVKPNTLYTIGRVNVVAEFDENFIFIKKTKLNSSYGKAEFTTGENTKYINFNVYVTTSSGSPVFDIYNTVSMQEGSHEELLPKQTNADLPVVDELFGIQRVFKAAIEDKSITPEKLSDETVELINKQSRWKGKRILAIGDSVTAALKWQARVGKLLEMNVRTHAKGGIGIIQMVDGDGSGTPPEGYDPDNFGVETIYALSTEDVKDVDIIVLMGFYNVRSIATSSPGNETDMYPTNKTFIGQLNYAIKRVYEELKKANNMQCKVIICSAHKYGKYSYSDLSAYDDGDDLYNATKKSADYNSLPCIDLMHCGNINKYNWNVFQNSNTPYNSNYIPKNGVNDGTNKPFASLVEAPDATSNSGKYITINEESGSYKSNGTNWEKVQNTAPWNADQLHLNTDGYNRIGDYIAGFINNL